MFVRCRNSCSVDTFAQGIVGLLEEHNISSQVTCDYLRCRYVIKTPAGTYYINDEDVRNPLSNKIGTLVRFIVQCNKEV